MGIFDKAKNIKKALATLKKLANKSQAELCIMVREQYIPLVGTRAARRQALINVGKELRRKARKNKEMTADELLAEYRDEPEFVKLWQDDLGLGDIPNSIRNVTWWHITFSTFNYLIYALLVFFIVSADSSSC